MRNQIYLNCKMQSRNNFTNGLRFLDNEDMFSHPDEWDMCKLKE